MSLEIIIDDVHHKLVRDEDATCGKCSLWTFCSEGRESICAGFPVRDDEYFQIVE